MNRTLIAIGLIAAGATSASAQGWWGSVSGREVDARQDRQQYRIEQGIRDGSLTRREAHALIEEQRQIADYERRAKADGYLDARERATLRSMQDNASRHIAAERHDTEVRRPWYRRWW